MRIIAAQFQHLEVTSCSIPFQTLNTSSCLSHGCAVITWQLCSCSLFNSRGTQITNLSGNCLLSQPELRLLLLLLFVYFCFLFLVRGQSLSCGSGPRVKVQSGQVLCTAQCVRGSQIPALRGLGVAPASRPEQIGRAHV